MKGDITNIESLLSNNAVNYDAVIPGGETVGQGEKESREMGSTMESFAAGNGLFVAGYQPSGGSPTWMPQTPTPSETTATVSNLASCHRLPQSRDMDTVFREPQQQYPPANWSPSAPAAPNTNTWSNVVSANAPSSPMARLATRSSSGETLLTSNMSQPMRLAHASTNFHYLSGAGGRSHSFDHNDSPSRNGLAKSFSFGNSDTNQQQQPSGGGIGIPPSHPGHSSYKESTLPTIKSGNTLHSPIMPTMLYSPSTSTPQHYHEYKSRPRSSSLGSYSPISHGGDSLSSMATDQTSPMSSPSLSPHVSPAMTSRKQGRDGDHNGHGPPPMWQLSDNGGDQYHSDHSPGGSPHHHPRLQSHLLPQSIPEHGRHDHATAHHGAYPVGPASPPRHSSAGSHHHQYPMYPRRPASSHAAPSHHHHRSSTEVLKTLLRKKACLYEPETSLAVSLATWLVGRRLALSKGYFTRQHLQSGVHACVAPKIARGHVTRTKVNRCMQVVLNSCFHYIIPRPDGSEECGAAFRSTFAAEAADEEHLLGTLSPPWNDLALPSLTAEDEFHSSLFHDSDDDGGHPPRGKRPSKEQSSPSASQAGDSSLESVGANKRSVLLCFNENIRCAADIFRCHNEFIRDVAHTGNLNLCPNDWHDFFAGTKAYRKRGGGVGGPASEAADGLPSRHFHLADVHDRTDRRGLSKLRTTWCAKRYDHDHAFCAFAHVNINRGWLRRDPLENDYLPIMCPHIKPLQLQPGQQDAGGVAFVAEDCYVNMCPLGVRCNHSHSREEVAYHPEIYKTGSCRYTLGMCPSGDICPNVHDASTGMSAASHGGYGNRHGKRHYQDHPPFYGSAQHHHPGSKKRGSSSTYSTSPGGGGGCAASGGGFNKLPNGSPMLYVDPAPLSEFEKTLLLPGLQAIFRDHSASVFSFTLGKSSPYKYGPFGYYVDAADRQQRMGGNGVSDIASSAKTIGRATSY
eukprot:CAMPEP_0181123530 /NCGR_PEP_ID=MMETSP1071-20121207/25955_1 /TAXON_ID=35127 /ORGANISM="Thalassiosira sp., Strain NH16" /LENGTH=963 /DNA_ID=CAMNT_0023208691 /DNA_START=531 /DNA_END=3422 /DNA_ORIENTATION=+